MPWGHSSSLCARASTNPCETSFPNWIFPLGEGQRSRHARRGSQQAAHPYLGPFLSSEARETLFTRGTWRTWVSPLTHGTRLTGRTLRTESREKAVGVSRANRGGRASVCSVRLLQDGRCFFPHPSPAVSPGIPAEMPPLAPKGSLVWKWTKLR